MNAAAQDPAALAVVALYWLAYFSIHSLLASLAVKRWVARRWPGRMPLYRLAYNGAALLLLAPAPVLLYLYRGPPLWQWHGALWWLAQALAATALLLFFHSARFYDTAEFMGLRQWREGERRVEDQERFRISPYHRFVRHPWYALGLVLVWTREMDGVMLISACAITLYFLAGLRLEERKLVDYHGDRYRAYRRKVPALIPRPWRYLTRAEAKRIAEAPRNGLRRPGSWGGRRGAP